MGDLLEILEDYKVTIAMSTSRSLSGTAYEFATHTITVVAESKDTRLTAEVWAQDNKAGTLTEAIQQLSAKILALHGLG